MSPCSSSDRPRDRAETPGSASSYCLDLSPAARSCGSSDCCSAGVPDATCDRVGPASAARNISCPRCEGRCSVCGGDVSAYMRMFEHGIELGRRLQREQYTRDNEPARWHE